MNILHLPSTYFPEINGTGATSRSSALALKLIPNCNQRILTFSLEGDEPLSVDGIPVDRVFCTKKIFSQPISLSFRKSLQKEISIFKPSVIEFHYPNPYAAHFLLQELKKNKDIKLVLFWHSDIVKQKFLRLFFVHQNYALLRRSSFVVASTPNYIDGSRYLSKYRAKTVVIPHAIDFARLQASKDDLEKSQEIRNSVPGKIICFAFARHVKYKGFSYLIDSFKQLDSSFVLFLGGAGPLTSKLKKQAAGMKNIFFLGKISDSQLREYMIASDIFCFSSITKNEAYGLALGEAMYMQKPAVTFTIPGSGVNYLSLKNVTCLEARNRDATDFANAIRKLGADPLLRKKLGQNGYQRICELCSPEVFGKGITSLYKKLLAK